MHIRATFRICSHHCCLHMHTRAALKVSFGSLEIDSEEGTVAEVCATLEGTGWFSLERELILLLDSDGGEGVFKAHMHFFDLGLLNTASVGGQVEVISSISSLLVEFR